MSPRITFRRRGTLAGSSTPRPRICTFTRSLVLHIRPRTEIFRSFLKEIDISRSRKPVPTDREAHASGDMSSVKRPFRVAFPKLVIQPDHHLTKTCIVEGEEEEEEEEEEEDEWQEEEEEHEEPGENEDNNEPRCHIRLKRLPNKPRNRFYYTSHSSSHHPTRPHREKSSILVFKRIYGTGRKKHDSFCGELSCRVCGPFISMWIEDLERGNPLLLGDDAPSPALDREENKENIRDTGMDIESATGSSTGTSVKAGDEDTSTLFAHRGTTLQKKELLPEVQYRLSCLEFGYDPLTFKAKGSRGTDGKKTRLITNSVPHVGVGTKPLGRRRTNNSLAASLDYDVRMADKA